MPRPIVSIVRVGREGNIAGAVREAVRLTGGFGKTIAKGDAVLIKPNAKNTTAPGLGVNTDARIVEAVSDLVLECGASRVVIADGAAFPSGNWDTMAAFEASGIARLAHRKNTELYDLNAAEPVIIDIQDGLVLKTFRTGKIVLDSDVIINIPVLKTHAETLVTLCLKNLALGIAQKWEKKNLHKAGLHESIVDIYANVRTHFNVVDGIVGLEGDGPNLPRGKTKTIGIVLAGDQGLAVDAVSCRIMGIEPREVTHLRMAAERGLGTIDLDQIEVVGEPIERVAKPFERPTSQNP